MAIIPLALRTMPSMRKRIDNQARLSGRKVFRRRVARTRLGEQRVEWIAPHRGLFLRGLFDGRLGGIRGRRLRGVLGGGRGFRRSLCRGLRRSLCRSLRWSLCSCGAEGFAGDGAGVCGALGVWDRLEAGFVNWSRTALGWTFGCSCAKAHVARTADRASGNRVRDDFASRIVSRLDSAYLRAG